MEERAGCQFVEFHQVVAERLAEYHRQGADGETMVVERGIELSLLAHRHKCSVGADGSRDDGDFLYRIVDQSWICGACFADVIEDGFDRLSQFVARLSSHRQFLAQ